MDKKVPRDCVRLVKYEEALDYIDHSWDGEDDTPIGTILGGVKSIYSFDLLMEIKKPEEQFEVYKPGGWFLPLVLIWVFIFKAHFIETPKQHLIVTVQLMTNGWAWLSVWMVENEWEVIWWTAPLYLVMKCMYSSNTDTQILFIHRVSQK